MRPQALIVRRGGGSSLGGGSSVYAIIRVFYPIGELCYCTNENFTLVSREDSLGEHMFCIPYPGVWTVYRESSQDSPTFVEITKEGQYECINLDSPIYFEEYNLNSPLTGGWTYVSANNYSSYAGVDFEETARSLSASIISNNSNITWYNGVIITKAPIDLSKINTLEITVDSLKIQKSSYNWTFGVSSTKSYSPKFESSITMQSAGIYTLDVSKLSVTNCYIAIYSTLSGGGTNSITVTKIRAIS